MTEQRKQRHLKVWIQLCWLFMLDLSLNYFNLFNLYIFVECDRLEAEMILTKSSSMSCWLLHNTSQPNLNYLLIYNYWSLSVSLSLCQCLPPVWPVSLARERPLWPAPAPWTVLATARARIRTAPRASGRSATPWKCPAEPWFMLSHAHI